QRKPQPHNATVYSLSSPNWWERRICHGRHRSTPQASPPLKAGCPSTDRERVCRGSGSLLRPRIHGIIRSFSDSVAENISRAMSVSDEAKFEPARRIQFAFTDEQEQFRAAIRRFLQEKSPPTEVRRLMDTAAGYDPEIWRQLSEQLALPGIHIPEQYGGAGFGMVELCIVTEEMGRALLCAPYFSTAVLAANAILNAGTEAQKSSLLPDLARGVRLAALAVTEPNGQWDPQAI